MIPKSGLTAQERTSPRCPLSTCIGPSSRRLRVGSTPGLFVPLEIDNGLLGVVGVAEASDDILLEWVARCTRHSMTVVSRDPVTR